MNNWIVIALVAGLSAGLLYGASVQAPSLLTFALFYLAPMPLFMAGLTSGVLAAALGGVAGTGAVMAFSGGESALQFAVTSALAPVVLTHLALINRPRGQTASGDSEGEAGDRNIQWYPEGRLAVWTAVLAGVLVCAVIIIVGRSAHGFQAVVREQVDAFIAAAVQAEPQISQANLRQAGDLIVTHLPVIAACMWFLATLVNMALAARLLTAAGRSLRPWARFRDLTVPRKAGLGLSAACLTALLPGTLGLFGWVFAWVLMAAFALSGLAVLHALTDGVPMRGFLLGALYVALVVLNWLLIVPLAMLALADIIFAMRARSRPNPPNPGA